MCYERTMSEWQGCEAIVKQREREQHAAALAKCSSGASIDSGSQKLLHRDSTLSNEVSLTWGGLWPGVDLAWECTVGYTVCMMS